MLATVTLATENGWFGTWIGSTVGMVAADALAIAAGAMLGKQLAEKAIEAPRVQWRASSPGSGCCRALI
jgi:Ca2+/H+ antiporter, TMEM165/GDT1 family